MSEDLADRQAGALAGGDRQPDGVADPMQVEVEEGATVGFLGHKVLNLDYGCGIIDELQAQVIATAASERTTGKIANDE